MTELALNRLAPGASPEDRRDFAASFNATLDQLGIKPGEEFTITVVDGDPPPQAGRCRFCGERVDPEGLHTWHRESGYVKPRARGMHGLAIKREHFDDLACDRCITRMKRGISPRQESLYPSTAEEFDKAMPMTSGREAVAAQRRHEEALRP